MTLHTSLEDHAPTLKRYALRLTKDTAAAEDLVQDTFIRMLARKPCAQQPENSCSYMISVMHNLFVDGTRRKDFATTLPIEDVEPIAPDAPQSLKLTCAETLEAIAKLPPDYRDVLTRHACEGQSYGQIAEDLDLPLGTVMSRINRARIALCDHLHLDRKTAGEGILDEF